MTLTISRSKVLAGSAAVFAWPRASGAQQLQKVRLIGVHGDDMTPAYYALSKGMYLKAGLDVEMIAANSGTAATAAVVSGAYELGKGSVIASLLAHIRDLPLVLIANGVMWDSKAPVALELVTADSEIKTARDVTGKTASAAALNDIVTLALNAWVDKNGGDSTSIKWVEIPNSAEADALIAHRVDLCNLNEPQLSAALDTGKVRVFAPTMDAIGYHPGDHYVVAAYFANKEWAAKNPQLCREFARVTYEAARYTNTHHAETAQMMADVTKIPVETIRKINRPPGATSSDPALLQPVIDAAAKYKNIPRAFPAKEIYLS